eukprot:TRINITY_DN36116_c0_g2_i1.p1 TRINITY_DN36116_c0_g2~~TRINITY_DN36116_c0_g2_i1.p1  ORF type:complete len:110 (-),score=8.07 TRINITY_DN36116_c0_g2_i1:227-556(-)
MLVGLITSPNCLGVETALPEIIDSSLGSTGNTFMFRGKNDFSLAHLQEHKNIMVPRKQNPDKLINKQNFVPPRASYIITSITLHHFSSSSRFPKKNDFDDKPGMHARVS